MNDFGGTAEQVLQFVFRYVDDGESFDYESIISQVQNQNIQINYM